MIADEPPARPCTRRDRMFDRGGIPVPAPGPDHRPHDVADILGRAALPIVLLCVGANIRALTSGAGGTAPTQDSRV